MERLFTYGVLQYPEIMQALTGETPISQDATIYGYKVQDIFFLGVYVQLLLEKKY